MAEKNNQEGQAPKKTINVGLIMTLAFALLNLGVMGAGAYLVYASTIGWHAPSLTEAKLRQTASVEKEDLGPYIYTMEKFTVNLDGEPRRMIGVEISLDMLSQESFEEVINTKNRAKARDKIVRILNSQTFSDLESIQGKLFLKNKIATEINSLLSQGAVKDVYFGEFVVQ